MRAFVLPRYGGPEVAELRDLPAPVPRADQLLVRVRAAGLNPVDWKTREGKLKVIRRYPLPIAMGNELSGVVEEVGASVTKFKKGDRIYARVDKDVLGAFAELAVVDEAHAAPMPKSIEFEAAAAVPLAGLTALQALRDELFVKPGYKVFIPAGAGGVGTFAIQLAKWLGATVATTASPRGAALVKHLGADVIVDYTKDRFEETLRDYDGVFDLLGGDDLKRSFAVLKPGGRVVSISGMPEPTTARKDLGRGSGLAFLFWLTSFKSRSDAKRAGASYRYLFMHPSGADLEVLTKLIDEKKLEIVIDKVFPFADAKEAFAHLETGRAKGKIVLSMA